MGFIFNRKKKVSKDGTKMGGFFFLPVISLGENYPGVDPLICKDGTKINFLLDLLTEVNFPRVLDPKRENYMI